ncbi:Zinc finger TFIIS-type protein [Apiospora sp. TS-2023a]
MPDSSKPTERYRTDSRSTTIASVNKDDTGLSRLLKPSRKLFGKIRGTAENHVNDKDRNNSRIYDDGENSDDTAESQLYPPTEPEQLDSSTLFLPGFADEYGHEEQQLEQELYQWNPPDPQWIDIEDIRQWIYTCDLEHGEECHPNSIGMERPIWLIDVKQACLVPAEEHRYLALSYVWGGVESSQATTDNIELLQLPGILQEEDSRFLIPATIRHAMGLTKMLGEGYLWVDRFCICQDDIEEKHSQLQSMADIYGNAYLTIVAANEWDANHGLRGLKGVTKPRGVSQYLTTHQYSELMDLNNTIWSSRGWTFQEDLFSRRRLLFQYQMVRWECSRKAWHESTGVTGRLPGEGPPRVQSVWSFRAGDAEMGSSSLSKLDALAKYFVLVNNYNTRNLSYPEDGLRAYLGVIKQFSTAFPAGFFWGLPVSEFHAALLWQPKDTLTRRRTRGNGADTLELPSWSWVGWQGGIDAQICASYKSRDPKPLCVWKAMDESQMLHPLLNNQRPEGNTQAMIHDNRFLYIHAPVARAWFGCQVVADDSPVDAPGELAAWGFGSDHYITLQRIWICSSPDHGKGGCGALCLSPGLRNNSHAGEQCELLAISTAKHKYGLGKYLQFNYVLWIGREDDVAHRKGLGVVLVDDWEALNPKMEDIVLG